MNEQDKGGTPHGFAGVEAGEFLELFVQGESDYGLYQVVSIHDETLGASAWWVIEVDFVTRSWLTDTSTADNGDDIRVKIFQPPTSGDDGDNSGAVSKTFNLQIRSKDYTEETSRDMQCNNGEVRWSGINSLVNVEVAGNNSVGVPTR